MRKCVNIYLDYNSITISQFENVDIINSYVTNQVVSWDYMK